MSACGTKRTDRQRTLTSATDPKRTADVTVVELAQQMDWFQLRGYFSSDTYQVFREPRDSDPRGFGSLLWHPRRQTATSVFQLAAPAFSRATISTAWTTKSGMKEDRVEAGPCNLGIGSTSKLCSRSLRRRSRHPR